jgi:hypothetical protein
MDVVLSRLSTQLLSPLSTDELLFQERPSFLSRYVTYVSYILLSTYGTTVYPSCVIFDQLLSPRRYCKFPFFG